MSGKISPKRDITETERIEYRGREHLCVYYELRRED